MLSLYATVGMKKLSPKEFEAIYRKVPRITAEVIVQTPRGIVLTLRDIDPYKGQWHIPGGTVLFGETLERAVRRVAKEELGIAVTIKKILGYIEYPSARRNGGYGWTIGIAFLTKLHAGKLRGSAQGKSVRVFRALPDNLIVEQETFLQKQRPKWTRYEKER
jgi:ADP-ribose pyrophosphatase YjhB (NUDIX family)